MPSDFDRKSAAGIREHMTNILNKRKEEAGKKMGVIDADMHNWNQRQKRLDANLERIDRKDGKNDNKLDKAKVKKVLMAKRMKSTKNFYQDKKGRIGMK